MSIVFRVYDDERGTFGALRAADRWLRTALRACAAGDVAAAEDAVRRARKLLNAAWERARDNEPERKSGRKNFAARDKAVAAWRKGPPDDEVWRLAVAAYRRDPTLRTRTAVAEVVAAECRAAGYEMSERTVRRRIQHLAWPPVAAPPGQL
ncbi:MAG: hypothetical protein DIU79_12760 [Actinobacteria bacterium]|nr:MAG: hypothetical protein DIU79_12760 [Actinomycetota bacterium]